MQTTDGDLERSLAARLGPHLAMLVRFGIVGGTGVVVNMVAIIVCNKLGPGAHTVALDLPLTDYNVRWYHVYATVAFLVANLWNFQLNRSWTFRSTLHAPWLREYLPFMVSGLLALAVNLGLLTLLLHPGSPLELSPRVFDDSTGFRTRLYWAQLIAIAVVTPFSFVINKFWTFSSVLGMSREEAARPPVEEGAEEGTVSDAVDGPAR